MKLLFYKNDLQNAINIVSKAVPSKTTMSILEYIMVEADSGEITFTANDMRLAIKTTVKGDILEPGRIAVNAKLFGDICRSLPDDGEVIISEENENISIRCGRANFNIMGTRGDDFPTLPEVERQRYICISQFALKQVINQTIFSVCADETVNMQMSGELFEVKGNKLRVVSLDGHRISLRNLELRDEYEDIKVIVPGKTLAEISRIIPGDADKDVYIYFTTNFIMFEFDDTIVLSRLIEGQYFQVDQMISIDYATRADLNRLDFMSSIDRAILMAKESDKKPIVVSVKDDVMELTMRSMIGSMRDEIDITKTGPDLTIGLNPRYLMDIMRVVGDNELSIYFVNARTPVIIRNDDMTYMYVVLPINIKSTV